ncbi:MAG: hypothetical protein IT431_13810 [Phycisphaerales bacterium]|nr:hypothetical protein [Phycisphaerales bacterium]
MTRPRRPVTGLPALLAAISDSDLSRGEVAVLKAMAEFGDWGTGANTTASLASIAEKAHYGPRRAAEHMASLVEKGIVVIVRASPGGKGNTTVRRIDLDALRARSRGSSAPSDRENPGRELCNPRTQTMQSVRANYAGTADNQGRDQSKPPPAGPRSPCLPAVGEAARSPGGVEGVVGVVGVVDLLRKHGVSTPKARALAARLPAEVVRVGISMWKPMREHGARAGVLVNLLQDGTATEEHRRRSNARASQCDRELLTRRTAQVGVLMGALGEYRNCVDRRDELLRLERVVRSVWPTNEALAAAGVLTDDELAAARERPLELLATLEAEAGKHRAAEPGPRPVVRRDAGQAALGGRA